MYKLHDENAIRRMFVDVNQCSCERTSKREASFWPLIGRVPPLSAFLFTPEHPNAEAQALSPESGQK
jgi:hypothetical protein